MSIDTNIIKKAINDTRADIEKYLNNGEFEMMAPLKAWDFINASQKKYGHVIYKTMDDDFQVEMQCNRALILVMMMDLLEEYGIEEFIKLEATRRMIGVSIEKVNKNFDTPEEMEVFKKMRNMSAEELEKLKNEK